jgi:hypothetical protein
VLVILSLLVPNLNLETSRVQAAEMRSGISGNGGDEVPMILTATNGSPGSTITQSEITPKQSQAAPSPTTTEMAATPQASVTAIITALSSPTATLSKAKFATTTTITPSPEATLTYPISLSLRSEPVGYIPGETLALVWEITPQSKSDALPKGFDEDIPALPPIVQEGWLELSLSIPEDFTPIGEAVFWYDAATHRLTLPITTTFGSLLFEVPLEVSGTFKVQAELWQVEVENAHKVSLLDGE